MIRHTFSSSSMSSWLKGKYLKQTCEKVIFNTNGFFFPPKNCDPLTTGVSGI